MYSVIYSYLAHVFSTFGTDIYYMVQARLGPLKIGSGSFLTVKVTLTLRYEILHFIL